MEITLSSILTLVPIEFRKDKRHYIVEDKALGQFYEMSEVCIDAMRLINEGKILAEIQQQLKENYTEEDIDIIDFAEQLQDLQLILEVDGVKLAKLEKKIDSLGFLWLPSKLGGFFFNKFSYFFYSTLFILNIALLLTYSSLFPHYKDLFLFNYMTLNIPAWLFITFCLVLIHEFGHILAMRASNLPTRLEVGHRLFLIVLETDMSSVWKLPSKERNVLYFAGICFDTVILSIALIAKLIVGNGSGIFFSIMSIIVLDTVIRMVYQLCVYMKTDLYYVFENVSGCYNLMENAQYLISKRIPILKSKELDEIFTGERKTVFFYSIFYALGIVLTVSLYFIFYIPQLLFAWKKVLPGFTVGPTSIPFWDATLFSLQIIIGLVLLLYSWRKKYVQR